MGEVDGGIQHIPDEFVMGELLVVGRCEHLVAVGAHGLDNCRSNLQRLIRSGQLDEGVTAHPLINEPAPALPATAALSVRLDPVAQLEAGRKVEPLGGLIKL